MAFGNERSLVHLTSTGDFKKWSSTADSLALKQLKFVNNADSGIYIDGHADGLALLTGAAAVKAQITQNGGVNLSENIDIVAGSASSRSIFSSLGANTLTLGGATSTVSVAGAASVDGTLVVTGMATFNGGVTTIASTELVIGDNIAFVNSGPAGTKNAGYAAERYQAANDLGTGDVVTDANALVVTIADIGDQTGMTNVQVTLAGGSATDDYYIGMWALSAAGNARKITAYNGTTKLATVASAWTTQPANTEALSIYSPFHGLVYNETTDRWVVAHLAGSSAANAILDHLNLQAGAVVVDDSLSLADSASLYLGASNDLTIVHNGTNSSIVSTTGSFTIDNTNATGDTVIQLGADTTDVGFVVKNDSSNELFRVKGDGSLVPKGGATFVTGGGNFSIGAGMGGGMLSFVANNATQATLSAGSLVPETDSALALGSTGKAFSTAYVDTLTSLDANDRVKIGTNAQVAVQLPVFTTAELANIAAPADGDLVFDSDENAPKFWTGAAWAVVSAVGVITGTTNLSFTINSDGGASADEDASLVLISDDGVNKDTGTITYIAGTLGGSDRANYGTWSVGAHVKIADDKKLIFGTGDDVDVSWLNGSSSLDMNITGGMTLDLTAGISIDSAASSNFSVTGADLSVGTLTSGNLSLSSAGTVVLDAASSVTIGGTNATSVDISRSGQMTTVKGTLNVDGAVTFDSTLGVTGHVSIDKAARVGVKSYTNAATAPQSGDIITFSNTDADPRISRSADQAQNKVAGICASNGTSNTADGEVVYYGPVVVNTVAGEDFTPGDLVYVGAGADSYKAVTAATAAAAASGNWIQPIGIAISQAGGAGTALTMVYAKGAATQIP